MINCLINSGKPISTTVADLLYQKAREMVYDKKKRIKFKSAECEGMLETELESAALGTIAGIKFIATLAAESGDTTVVFIVRNTDLDIDGEWTGFQSMSDAEEYIRADALSERPTRLN